jgi:predicted transcriptional regulator
MSATIELDEQRRSALAKLARRRRLPLRRVLERAVDEFINRAEDEDLLENSARMARQTGLREADAAEIVRSWRRKDATKKRG